jgi:GR25 family glycosyltransferase involved in LPS biosynthesis
MDINMDINTNIRIVITIVVAITMIIVILYFYHKNKKNDTKEIKYLDGIDCIYWINLDRSLDRKRKMEEMFSDTIFAGIPIQRIQAFDGKTCTLHDKIKMKHKRNSNLEYACLLSHLKAIKTFSETDYTNVHRCKNAIIFEDDVTLEFKPFWKKSLQDIIDNAPPDWEIIQLCYNTNTNLTNEYTLNNYKKNDYGNIACMAAYIINNQAAKKFISETYNPSTNKYKLQDYHTHEADHYLYKCLRTYTYKYPYFVYPTDNDSTLHPEDLDSHVRSKVKLEQMYMQSTE